ncbi:PREDICTED: N-alpha-acetyltransferase 40 isoform X5 [Acromyrmex echinatior]|uniref:N-alpha-acetyltransferase 40 isoform X5 n=1 Tax=Acromyrmex echinatior TaxID=103372 RepID=UPI000580ED2B|nr:PREDICTED: N-alpha-acetyltransferase 40 isoform X5 [Acromyrmex echinatior]
MPKSARKTRRQLLAEKAMVQRRLINKANALANPLETLHKFHEYITKDNNMIKLACVKAKDAPSDCLSWILNIMERNMKKMYEQSSWGWNATEKQTELTEEMACYELQLEPSTRRKGLGRFMMSTLESMAYHNQMTKVVLTVFKHNSSAIQFFYALGYKLDNSYPPVSDLDYIILSKQNLCG